MKRREFLASLGAVLGAVAAWPVAATAQQGKPARIGFLALGNPDPVPFVEGVQASLRELGYIDGQTVVFELRSAAGNAGRLEPLAAELVALKVDVIVAFQTPAASASKRATADVPIIMNAGDPVGTGLIASLARPGGNVTGVSGAGAELGAKHIELLREILPAARHVAVLANAPDPFSRPFVERIQEAAKALNFELKPFMLKGPGEIEAAFTDMAKSGTEGVIVQPSLPHETVAALAIKHRLPSFSPNPAFPGAGGLMAYSADYEAMYRDCAMFVDKVLKGRKPADLPVQLPSKFWLNINLKTAKAIGVTVPGTMLTRADQVIE